MKRGFQIDSTMKRQSFKAWKSAARLVTLLIGMQLVSIAGNAQQPVTLTLKDALRYALQRNGFKESIKLKVTCQKMFILRKGNTKNFTKHMCHTCSCGTPI